MKETKTFTIQLVGAARADRGHLQSADFQMGRSPTCLPRFAAGEFRIGCLPRMGNTDRSLS